MPYPKETYRLILHPMLGMRDELATVVGWLNDPDVVRFSEQRHVRHDIQTQLNYFNGLKQGDRYIGVYHDDLLIGTLTAHIDSKNDVANVGIMMGEKRKWGQGFGIEAWTALCDELFLEGIRKIEAGCMSINYRMMAICQHYGMVEEGRQDKHYLFQGGTADLVHWGKFNEPK
jgi:[ribosomal protein S5]-alanine N-acetyltransferase